MTDPDSFHHPSLPGWAFGIDRERGEVLVSAPDCDPGSKWVKAGKGTLEARLLHALVESLINNWDARPGNAGLNFDEVSMPDHWSVVVSSGNETLVSIGNDWLSGTTGGDTDDDQMSQTIRGAAIHLLAFIGHGMPTVAAPDLNG